MKLLLALLAFLALAASAWAHTGFGIVVDRDGHVVFLDATRSTVWRMEKDGRLTALARDKHGNTLVQDAAGNLYVQHVNQSLWRIAPDGSVTEILFPARNASAGRVGSLDELIAVDAAGNFYVSSGNDFYQQSPRLLKITPAGEVTLVAGSEPGHADGRGAEAKFNHIRSAVWGPDGALYVADGNSVRRVTTDGEVTTLAGGEVPGRREIAGALEEGPWKAVGDGSLHRVFSVAVSEAGEVFAADSDNFRIVRIGSEGITTIRETRPPWKPAGVAAANGRVYGMEQMFVPVPVITSWFTTHRVVQIESGGRFTTLATVGGGAGYAAGILFAGALLGMWQFARRRKARRMQLTQPSQPAVSS